MLPSPHNHEIPPETISGYILANFNVNDYKNVEKTQKKSIISNQEQWCAATSSLYGLSWWQYLSHRYNQMLQFEGSFCLCFEVV